jgi:hypothetical protein
MPEFPLPMAVLSNRPDKFRRDSLDLRVAADDYASFRADLSVSST